MVHVILLTSTRGSKELQETCSQSEGMRSCTHKFVTLWAAHSGFKGFSTSEGHGCKQEEMRDWEEMACTVMHGPTSPYPYFPFSSLFDPLFWPPLSFSLFPCPPITPIANNPFSNTHPTHFSHQSLCAWSTPISLVSLMLITPQSIPYELTTFTYPFLTYACKNYAPMVAVHQHSPTHCYHTHTYTHFHAHACHHFFLNPFDPFPYPLHAHTFLSFSESLSSNDIPLRTLIYWGGPRIDH